MIVEASVVRVQSLPERADQPSKEPIVSVSLEGFSVLCKGVPPVEGDLITGVVTVQWRKDKRPIHWLGKWESRI